MRTLFLPWLTRKRCMRHIDGFAYQIRQLALRRTCSDSTCCGMHGPGAAGVLRLQFGRNAMDTYDIRGRAALEFPATPAVHAVDRSRFEPFLVAAVQAHLQVTACWLHSCMATVGPDLSSFVASLSSRHSHSPTCASCGPRSTVHCDLLALCRGKGAIPSCVEIRMLEHRVCQITQQPYFHALGGTCPARMHNPCSSTPAARPSSLWRKQAPPSLQIILTHPLLPSSS